MTAYDSLADLAAAGVDAVVISTPCTPIPLVREAVGLGLPVVCDKPFAADAAAARATVELAARGRHTAKRLWRCAGWVHWLAALAAQSGIAGRQWRKKTCPTSSPRLRTPTLSKMAVRCSWTV